MSGPPPRDYDPVYLHAKRETIALVATFAVFLVWSISVCWFLGYHSPEAAVRTVLGIPHWVFWGVAVPWLAANVFTFVFSQFFMADDPLGEALDEQGMQNAESDGAPE